MLSNTEQVFIILCLSPWQFYHPPKSRQQFAANIKRAAAAFLEIPDFWTVRINLSQFAKPVVVFGGLAPSHPLDDDRARKISPRNHSKIGSAGPDIRAKLNRHPLH